MAQLNITLDQEEILALLSKDHDGAFRKRDDLLESYGDVAEMMASNTPAELKRAAIRQQNMAAA